MKCENIEEQLSAYIDNELSKREMTTVEQHLLDCATCSKSLAQLKHIADMVSEIPPVSMSDRASERLEAAIEERLYAPEPELQSSERPAWWRWVTRPAFGAVAASFAVVVLAVLVVSPPIQREQSLSMNQKAPSDKILSEKPDDAEKTSPEKSEYPSSNYVPHLTRQDIDSLAKELNEQPPADSIYDGEARGYDRSMAGAESKPEDKATKKTKKIDAAKAASIASKTKPVRLYSAWIGRYKNEEAWIIAFEVLNDDQDASRHFQAAAVSTTGRLLYLTN